MPKGEKNKLNDRQRQQIHDLKGKKSGYKVAKDYNVSHTTIYKIWNKQPPKSCRMALRKIHTELEMTRGFNMSQPVFDMWCNIHIITTQALENP